MSDKTALGDRMKLYERAEAGRRFMPLLPICIRIDGKRFSSWTQGLARPYDERLSSLMVAVTTRLVEDTGAVIGYTQSDEISLIRHGEDSKQQLFLDGRIQGREPAARRRRVVAWTPRPTPASKPDPCSWTRTS